MAGNLWYDKKSIMAMAWVYVRAERKEHGGGCRQYISAALKRSWAEEKMLARKRAEALARFQRDARVTSALNSIELERMAGQTVRHTRGIPAVRTGRFQGGRW